MATRDSTLLAPGKEAWSALNEEKRRLLRSAPETTVEELLRRGMRLSRQAGRLARAVDARGGDTRP
ncbi:MAG: hypothetical protein M3401_10880 [Actinomycetota bacterium]|nr:hypothetical protein [Actinomycetota bacterium]